MNRIRVAVLFMACQGYVHLSCFGEDDDAMQLVVKIQGAYQTSPGESWQIAWKATTAAKGPSCCQGSSEPLIETAKLEFRLKEGIKYESESPRLSSISSLNVAEQLDSQFLHQKVQGVTNAGFVRSRNVSGGQCTSAYDFWPFLLHACVDAPGFTNQNRFEILPREYDMLTLRWQLSTLVDAKLWFDDTDGYSLRKLQKEVLLPKGKINRETWEIENVKVNNIWFPSRMTRIVEGIPIEYEFDAPVKNKYGANWLDLKIPKGTTVYDVPSGIVYYQGVSSRSEMEFAKLEAFVTGKLNTASPVMVRPVLSRAVFGSAFAVFVIVIYFIYVKLANRTPTDQ